LRDRAAGRVRVPTIRKRGKRFQAQVRMSGFPTRTASFPTLRLAERWATKIEADMIEGRHFRGVEARRRTLGEAIDRYLAEELPKKRNGSTHRSNLPWWKERLGHLKLADVTPAILVEQRGKLARETFIRANPKSARTTLKEGEEPRRFTRSPGTVNRYLAVLSHLYSVARREWHWVSHNPFDGVGKLRESRGRVRFLSEEERTALLRETAKNPVLHTFVVLALSTAARAGELLNLKWQDVDLNDGRILLLVTKNAQPRTAWLHGEAKRLLTEHADRRHPDQVSVFVSPTGRRYEYHKEFRTACDAAGVQNFRFHDLRHSAATYLAREGASEQQLKAIGGWKSSIVSRYVHLAATETKDLVQKMNEKILGTQKKA
jgi:integrase